MRFRFQYRLSTLLIICTLSAVGLKVYKRWEQRPSAAVERLKDMQAEVGYSESGTQDVNGYSIIIGTAWRGGDEGLRNITYLDDVREIWIHHVPYMYRQQLRSRRLPPEVFPTGPRTPPITDRGIRILYEARSITTLNIFRTVELTDDGLIGIEQLDKLKTLLLTRTKITDRGLIHLQPLKRLETLALAESPIGDQGIANLPTLPHLERLDLDWTLVTDNAIPDIINKFKSVRKLSIMGTKISATGLARLEKAFPNHEIVGP